MFNVKLIKEYSYNIAVKGYSKINSLGANIIYEGVNLVVNILSLINASADVGVSHERIVVDDVKLNTKMSSDINYNTEVIDMTFSSNEKISCDIGIGGINIDANLKSRERIYVTMKDNVKIDVNPHVGHYRTLGELDAFTLGELDPSTLGELDVTL